MSFPLAAWGALVMAADTTAVIRVNQVGYLPDAPKVAVLCSLAPSRSRQFATFVVRDARGRTVLGPVRTRAAGSFGPCVETWRLDFSAVRRAGTYTVETDSVRSP